MEFMYQLYLLPDVRFYCSEYTYELISLFQRLRRRDIFNLIKLERTLHGYLRAIRHNLLNY